MTTPQPKQTVTQPGTLVRWPGGYLGQRIFSSFTLDRLIAQSAHAAAFLASQDGTDRRAVIKIAAPTPRSSTTSEATRFLTEFRAASSVHHPHIATVYLAGTTHDGLPAIAMEYVEGDTLHALLARPERLPLNDLLLIWEQLAEALEAIHAAGIIHRDLTPANIIVSQHPNTARPFCKILDFGASRFEDLASNSLFPIGTPRYMAPEQLHLEPCTASDVYALGATLWWAVTGQELLGHLRSIADVLRYFHNLPQTSPDLTPLQKHLPEELASLIGAMLHPSHAQRPTAGELRLLLKQAVQRLNLRSAAHKATKPSPPVPHQPQPEAELARWAERLRVTRDHGEAFVLCRSIAVAAHRTGDEDLARAAREAQRAVLSEGLEGNALQALLQPLLHQLILHKPPYTPTSRA